jgi:hypothetical protein
VARSLLDHGKKTRSQAIPRAKEYDASPTGDLPADTHQRRKYLISFG